MIASKFTRNAAYVFAGCIITSWAKHDDRSVIVFSTIVFLLCLIALTLQYLEDKAQELDQQNKPHA